MSEKSSLSSYLPSMGDLLFLIVFFFPLTILSSFLFGDGGTGWHLAAGAYMWKHCALPASDFITYTCTGAKWIQLYWLGDWLLYASEKLAGLNAVAVVSSATIAATYLCLYTRSRNLGCNMVLAWFITFSAAIASTVHFLARPHVFGYPLQFVVAVALEDFHRRKISGRRLVLVVVSSIWLWSNFHPSFLFGFGLLGLYLGGALLIACLHSNPDERAVHGREAGCLLVTFVLAVAATFVNPEGLKFWTELLSNISYSSGLLDSIDEFLSPNFHGGVQVKAFAMILGLVPLGLAIKLNKVSLPQLASVLGMAYLALYSVRHIPFFVIVAVPFICECFASTRLKEYFGDSGSRPVLLDRIILGLANTFANIDAAERSCNKHILPLAAAISMLIIALNGGSCFGKKVLDCHFGSDRFPVKTLQCIKDLNLPYEHGFNHVNWGGYIYHLTGMPVFIDDRASVVGDKFYLEYGRVVSLFPDWRDILKKYQIHWILFPKNAPLSVRLKADPEWRIVCEDAAAYLFVLKNASPDSTIEK